MRWTCAILGLGLWTALPSVTEARPTPGREIEIWVRAPGLTEEGVREQRALKALFLDQLPLVEASLFDAQLAATATYEGITLRSLLDRYDAPAEVDLALLHFDNGMIVPVALGGADEKAVFVATAIKSGKTFGSFPEVPKRKRVLPDPAPINFGRNKVVLPDGRHPMVPKQAQSTFSPWLYVDTLTGIELVVREKWERQFEANNKDADVKRGQAVFLGRCQYCHGVAEVGAAFGWDLIRPVPLYDYRRPNSLYAHVKMENSDALERGYQMPPQKDVEEPEIRDLWRWMKVIAVEGPRAYE